MKKIIFSLTALLILSAPLSAEETVFNEIWISPTAKLKDYAAAYIDKIDTDEVTFDLFDAYSGNEYSSEYKTDGQRRDDLVFEMRRRFDNAMGKAITVLRNKKAAANEKTLLIGLQISGEVRDQGLFDASVRATGLKSTDIAFSCQIYDSSSHEKLVSISDNYFKETTKESVSTLRGSNIDQWYKAMDAWADELAEFIRKETGR